MDQQQQQDEQEQESDGEENPQPNQGDSQQPDSLASLEELMGLSKEDALRILKALEEQEKELQKAKRKAAFKRVRRKGKDW